VYHLERIRDPGIANICTNVQKIVSVVGSGRLSLGRSGLALRALFFLFFVLDLQQRYGFRPKIYAESPTIAKTWATETTHEPDTKTD
jgi:hypothetical protein